MAAEALRVADPALLEQALQQGEVTVQRPSPSLFEYLGDLLLSLGKAVARAVARLFEMAGGGGTALVVLLGITVALALLFVAFLLFRLWQTRPRPLPARAELLPATAAPALADADWESEIERRLGRGEIHAALEALWWWLAGRLEAGSAERSWTTRELVLRAGRRDLLRAVLPLDRLLYAAVHPGADDVRSVLSTLRRDLRGESRT